MPVCGGHRKFDLNRGDACHSMIPYLAQGANSSIEDGTVIGLLLGKVTCMSQLPQALRLYQSIRKPRGEEIARESLKIVRTSFLRPASIVRVGSLIFE